MTGSFINHLDRPSKNVRWIIQETHSRWSNGVKRFYRDLIPLDFTVTIQSVEAEMRTKAFDLEPQLIVIWEVNRSNLVATIDSLLQIRGNTVSRLHLIACDQISLNHRLSLAEFDVSGFLEHPEDLYQLKPVFDGYFARLG